MDDRETTIFCTKEIRDLWPSPLARRWLEEYPQLFDPDDERLATHQPSNHFAQWFAAIHSFHRHGVHCLVEKYVFLSHPRKVALFHSILSEPQRDQLHDVCSALRVQPPDLLLYAPNRPRFWFAEVKGPGDTLSKKQRESHREITRRLGVPVEVINVRIVPGAP